MEATRDRSELVQWLADDFVPGAIAGSPAAMCLIFLDADLPAEITAKTGRIPASYGEAGGRRLSLLWLLDDDPEMRWNSCFAVHDRQIAESGHGRVEFAGAFIPTVPGSDTHIDEL